jgi:hypothetical protein
MEGTAVMTNTTKAGPKMARGKTTPASNNGSFTTYAHGVSDIVLSADTDADQATSAKAGAAIGPNTYLIRAANGVPFMAHLVPAGGAYGASGSLTAGRDMIEFYDARYEHKDVGTTGRRGQFVTRYYVADVLDRRDRSGYPDVGLDLYGGEPAWEIDGASMAEIRGWLDGASPADGPGRGQSLSEITDEFAEGLDAGGKPLSGDAPAPADGDRVLETIPGHFARDGVEYNRFIDDAYEIKRLYAEIQGGGQGGDVTLADGSRLLVGKDRFIVEPAGSQKGQRLTYKHTSREEAFRQADNLTWTATLRARGESAAHARFE